jgi:hypothetical protein
MCNHRIPKEIKQDETYKDAKCKICFMLYAKLF